jgi:serine/threonine protein kinase
MCSLRHAANSSSDNIPTAYNLLLAKKKLWPVDPMVEQNWSGRGQHAEFQKHERSLVDTILQTQEILGSSSSAVVQSVRCKRIILARKSIWCNPGRTMTRAAAIEEVAHLVRLKHAHIVRVIGTYVIGHELSILIYPVAQYNLDTFLHQATAPETPKSERAECLIHLPRFILCLSEALAYIHQQLVKHMDIKPQNILVRETGSFQEAHEVPSRFKIYIADFGISRSYKTSEATETEGPTMFTRKYAAPEVVDYDKRGLAADIFSLGCVFTEVVATMAGLDNNGNSFTFALRTLLQANEFRDASYQANVESVCRLMDAVGRKSTLSPDELWLHIIPLSTYTHMIHHMLEKKPAKRPSARVLLNYWDLVQWDNRSWCCDHVPDVLEATPETPASDAALST